MNNVKVRMLDILLRYGWFWRFYVLGWHYESDMKLISHNAFLFYGVDIDGYKVELMNFVELG